jgi:hypothetical protein
MKSKRQEYGPEQPLSSPQESTILWEVKAVVKAVCNLGQTPLSTILLIRVEYMANVEGRTTVKQFSLRAVMENSPSRMYRHGVVDHQLRPVNKPLLSTRKTRLSSKRSSLLSMQAIF